MRKAEIFFRLVDDGASTRAAVRAAGRGKVELNEVLCIPAVHLGALDGFETTVVAFTTDIPAFGGAWGKPLPAGAGSIHVAHTSEERIPKRQIPEAIQI